MKKQNFWEWQAQQINTTPIGKPKLYAGLKSDRTRVWVWSDSIQNATEFFTRLGDQMLWVARDKIREVQK